ncbi:hypothetical protein PSN13_06484 [Micromonospora saelicesensis]|uniref:Uncharacterized protein n=1 Tax=Micromonospora saelicesensis TaxID=285676 RepID=A0A328NC08_9ACTN|nr:hypothetical protein [Micromonospora saelicesensis]RAO26456.1 hypothetical protein PSN13_06484 [Micromonospora saelicesensis]
MSYMPRPQAPALPAAQAARMDRWWQWKAKRDGILREAIARFNDGDVEGFLAKDAEAQALPEPDIFNG